ncbi:MAG: hypothetical protein HC905_28585 [Bacteroidales bacterium]|nr:hypothetical protein [Bacteroidales bacterium]
MVIRPITISEIQFKQKREFSKIELTVEKGIILNAAVKDEKDDSLVHMQNLLKGQPHNYDTLKKFRIYIQNMEI